MKRSYFKTQSLLFVLLGLLLQSCNDPSSKLNKEVQNTVELDTVYANEKAEVGKQIDYDNTPVLNKVYVTARDGVYSKQQPEEQSAPVTYYEYGQPLQVIEVNGNWLGIRERVLKKIVRNGSNMESTGWEKMYVPRNAAGKLSDITLLTKDLNIIVSLDANGKTVYYEKGTTLPGYLKMELIDKQTFYLKKRTAVSYFLADTNTIRKENGVIRLPIHNGFKQYQDNNKPGVEDNTQEYNYVGQIDFLNTYVIAGLYWESWDYKLINKHSGVQEVSLNALPNISHDRRHLISISDNGYTGTADLELYNIKNNKVRKVMAASFKYWAPVNASGIFWGIDGSLYVAVLPSSKAFSPQENVLNSCQYIKIRVL